MVTVNVGVGGTVEPFQNFALITYLLVAISVHHLSLLSSQQNWTGANACMILVSMHGLTGTGSRFPTYSIGELCCEGHQCQSLLTVLTAAEMEKIYSNPFSNAVK